MHDDVVSALAEPRIPLAKEKAHEVWQTLGGEAIPVRLNPIFTALGIPTKAEHLEADGVCQGDDHGGILIMYREDMPVVRQRFTVAHELAHFVLEHVTMDGGPSSHWSHNAQEAEANAFANELLLPSKDLKEFVKLKNKTLLDIAKRYWVSTSVASIAVLEHRLLNKIKLPATPI